VQFLPWKFSVVSSLRDRAGGCTATAKLLCVILEARATSESAGQRTILMTRARAVQTCFILAFAFTVLRVNGFSQAEGHASKPGPSIPGAYLPPNEQHPALALPIYRKSNHGVYVSVGTERSFIGAALTGAKGLYVIDYDLLAVRFANVNRALLAVSRNRVDYMNLRLTAPLDVWQQRSRELDC
jgi:hypothetical protein